MTVGRSLRTQNRSDYSIPDLNLSVKERELISQGSYGHRKNATPDQKKTSEYTKVYIKENDRILAENFDAGSEDAAYDPWKAHKYKVKAGIPSEPPGPSLLRADTFYRYHAWWFTGIRLFLVRLGRIFAKVGMAFLPAFFSVFGLSYGIGLAVDLFIVLKATFIPPLSKEERLKQEELKKNRKYFSFWEWHWLLLKLRWRTIRKDTWKQRWIRFKNIIRKDNRPYRMLNDFVWFSVNLIVFCTAGPLYLLLNPILNLVGFAFDTVHESFWLGRDAQKYIRLIKKIDHHIEELKEQLNTNPKEENLNEEIAKYKLIREQMKLKRNEIIRRRLWISVCTALVLIGMVFIFFPPTAIPGAFFIGAGLALVAGSVLTGLGRRLYLYTEEYGPKLWKKIKARKTPPNQNANEYTHTAKITLVLQKPTCTGDEEEVPPPSPQVPLQKATLDTPLSSSGGVESSEDSKPLYRSNQNSASLQIGSDCPFEDIQDISLARDSKKESPSVVHSTSFHRPASRNQQSTHGPTDPSIANAGDVKDEINYLATNYGASLHPVA